MASEHKDDSRLVVREAGDADVATFCSMSRDAQSGEPICDEGFVRWKHLDGPAGPATVIELLGPDSELRGRMWAQTRSWRTGATVWPAANPVDLLIAEQHRSMQALMQLIRTGLQPPADDWVVFHTSNPTTGFIYERLMRMKPKAELDALAFAPRPVGALSALRGRARGPFTQVLDSITATATRAAARVFGRRVGLAAEVPASVHEGLVHAFHAHEPIAHDRSLPWVAWRLRGPGAGYALRWIVVRGKAIGWVGLADREVDGLRSRFVIDLVLAPDARPGDVRRVWWRLIRDAARSPIDVLLFFGNLEGNVSQRHLARLPMARVPRERLPQRLPLFVPSVPMEGMEQDPVPHGYWTLADFDMV